MDDRTYDTGRLCIKGLEFTAISKIEGEGEFVSNGIIGLAPVPGPWNYVEQLFESQ